MLQKALGRSIDDTVMVIHLVLHRIFQAPVGGKYSDNHVV